MGNFENHMRYGVASYLLLLVAVGAATVYGVRSGVVEVGTGVTVGVGSAVLGFPLTMAGAGFPDIDHQDAKPHRWLRKWLSVSAGGVSVYGLLMPVRGLTEGVVSSAGLPSTVPESVAEIGVGVAGGVVGGVLVFYGVGFAKPKHRGITHALTTGAVVAGVVGLGVGFAGSELVSPEIGYVAGGIGGLSFFVGFLSHLQCDGLLVGFLPSYSG